MVLSATPDHRGGSGEPGTSGGWHGHRVGLSCWGLPRNQGGCVLFQRPGKRRSLTFTVSSSDEAVATASVSGSVVTVTPVAVGSAIITVTAQDPDGLSATQAIAVEVVNQAPVAVGAIAAVMHTFGDDSDITREVAPYFIDPENDALTFTASSSDEAVATAERYRQCGHGDTASGWQCHHNGVRARPRRLKCATQTIAVTVTGFRPDCFKPSQSAIPRCASRGF